MKYHSYLAELLGTFVLTLSVGLSITFALPLSTPVIAALTLGLFVYTVGGISGAHLNPAVTIALLSVNKIKPKDAGMYVFAQLVGATLALTVIPVLTGQTLPELPKENLLSVGLAEAIGAFLLAFGVSAVVWNKVHESAAGLVIGGSLLLGLFIASGMSNAVLNPAVAWGIGSFTPMYILGPLVGAVGGAWGFKKLAN